MIRLDPWDGARAADPDREPITRRRAAPLIRDYGAMIAPTNGQTAGFLHNDVAPLLRDGARVLYLGDMIWPATTSRPTPRRVLERYHDLAGSGWRSPRAQVRDHGLTPIIKSDRRFKNGGAHEAVETEALSQRLIVQIVRDRLEALLPAPLANSTPARRPSAKRSATLSNAANDARRDRQNRAEDSISRITRDSSAIVTTRGSKPTLLLAALDDVVTLKGRILEPACGQGHMAAELRRRGFRGCRKRHRHGPEIHSFQTFRFAICARSKLWRRSRGRSRTCPIPRRDTTTSLPGIC